MLTDSTLSHEQNKPKSTEIRWKLMELGPESTVVVDVLIHDSHSLLDAAPTALSYLAGNTAPSWSASKPTKWLLFEGNRLSID